MKIKLKSKYDKRQTPREEQLASQGISVTDPSIFAEIFLKGHDEDFVPTTDSMPTAARPGSLEKLLVMSERLIRGEPLFHPDDERIHATNEQWIELRTWSMANKTRK